MRFKIIRGLHVQDGEVYEAGKENNIIESSIDLIRAFNNNGKFERVSVPVDQLESTAQFHNDVSSEFPGCAEMGMLVFHEGKQYFVVDRETNQPVHKSKITSTGSVRTVLDGLK